MADRIHNDPQLRGSQQGQRTLLSQHGIDERMLWLLQQGRGKVQDYLDMAERHGRLSNEEIAQAFELQLAYSGLTQSVDSMTKALGAQLGQRPTPMLTKWSD